MCYSDGRKPIVRSDRKIFNSAKKIVKSCTRWTNGKWTWYFSQISIIQDGCWHTGWCLKKIINFRNFIISLIHYQNHRMDTSRNFKYTYGTIFPLISRKRKLGKNSRLFWNYSFWYTLYVWYCERREWHFVQTERSAEKRTAYYVISIFQREWKIFLWNAWMDLNFVYCGLGTRCNS